MIWIPRVLASSNPGLELANAFGVNLKGSGVLKDSGVSKTLVSSKALVDTNPADEIL
jgi:hypothetical protein